MTEWTIFSNPWIQAWGLTLLHSIWQGALIAAALGIALRALRQHSARTRYALTVTAMGLFLLLTMVTLLLMAAAPEQRVLSAALQGGGTETSTSLSRLLQGRFDEPLAVGLFILFWLAGVAVMMLRTCAGIYLVISAKRRDISPLPGEWQRLLSEWFMAWRVERIMPVYLSARVQVPVIVGFLKQTLLLPASFLTTLSPEHVQAIIAHEVAHFIRRDALINFIQTFMEIVFFYNPGLWWISGRMREEREFCCDDYAIEKCGRPMALARALVNLQQLRSAPLIQNPALSAAGRLQQRIHRLFKTKEKSMNLREKLLAVLFLLGIALTVVPMQTIGKAASAGTDDEKKKKEERIEVRVTVDDGGEKHMTITKTDSISDKLEKVLDFKDENGKTTTITIKGDKIVSIIKDGKELDPEELKKLEHENKHLQWDVKEGDEAAKVEHIVIKTTADGDSVNKTVKVKVIKDGSLFEVSEGDSVKKIMNVKVTGDGNLFEITEDDSTVHKVMVLHDKSAIKAKQYHMQVGETIKAQLDKDGIQAGKEGSSGIQDIG